MKRFFLALACLAFAGCSAGAAPPAAQTGPVVVELFTSQSCSSCPPAEAYFRDLAKRPDLLTLEWHVDYWDTVNDHGVYKDPYSSPAATARQTAYNHRVRNTDQVFTPQAIIGGADSAAGFDQATIGKSIGKRASAASAVHVAATAAGNTISFRLENAPADAELLLVTFQRQAANKVEKGENHGRQLASANVVTAFRTLKLATTVSAPAPAAGQGCALLVHAHPPAVILHRNTDCLHSVQHLDNVTPA